MNNSIIKYPKKKPLFVVIKDYSYGLGGIKTIRQSLKTQKFKIINSDEEDIEIYEIKFSFFSEKKEIQNTKIYFKDENYPIKIKIDKKTKIPAQFFDIYSNKIIDHIKIKIFTSHNDHEINLKVINYKQKTKLELPFKENCVIVGNQFEFWAHRYLDDAEMGIDLIVVNATLAPYSNDFNLNKSHFCYKKPVFSPADGVIHKIEDGLPDNEKPYQQKAKNSISKEFKNKVNEIHLNGGNYIIVDHQNGEFSYLGHLKNKSIIVKKGDKVKMGQELAECGNSGVQSFSPHLHFQLMDGPDPKKSNTLPFNFSKFQSPVFKKAMFESKSKEHKQIIKFYKNVGLQLVDTK